jgi:hypothetical protein
MLGSILTNSTNSTIVEIGLQYIRKSTNLASAHLDDISALIRKANDERIQAECIGVLIRIDPRPPAVQTALEALLDSKDLSAQLRRALSLALNKDKHN